MLNCFRMDSGNLGDWDDVVCLAKISHVSQSMYLALKDIEVLSKDLQVFRALASFQRPQRPQGRGAHFADAKRRV